MIYMSVGAARALKAMHFIWDFVQCLIEIIVYGDGVGRRWSFGSDNCVTLSQAGRQLIHTPDFQLLRISKAEQRHQISLIHRMPPKKQNVSSSSKVKEDKVISSVAVRIFD